MEEQQQVGIEPFKSKVKLDTEKQYREYNAINYSKLKALSDDPSKVNSEMKETDAMVLGSIVDDLLTIGKMRSNYIPEAIEKPSGQLGEFCDYLISGSTEQEAYDLVGFKRDKLITVLDKFNSSGAIAYVHQGKEALEKTLVPIEIIMKAEKIVDILKSHDNTKHLFSKTSEVLSGIEIKYQVPIVFDLPNGLGEGKALIDLMVINHNTKEIYPYDLKTTSDKASKFPYNFIKWKYYIQSSFYYYGLKSISKYSVKGFRFIVASTTDIENPLIWNTTESDLYVGRNGISNPMSRGMVKGWEQLVQELDWHTKMDNWSHPKEIYEEGGLKLSVFDKWQ